MNPEILTAGPQLVALTPAAQTHFAGLLAKETDAVRHYFLPHWR